MTTRQKIMQTKFDKYLGFLEFRKLSFTYAYQEYYSYSPKYRFSFWLENSKATLVCYDEFISTDLKTDSDWEELENKLRGILLLHYFNS